MSIHVAEFGVLQKKVQNGTHFPAQTMKQVHGDRIQWVQAYGPEVEADAMMTEQPGLTLMVKSADCIPLAFADEKQGLAAAVHAGWRGLIKEIIPKTVAEMRRRGSDPRDIKVLIGPALGKECSEFSDPFKEIPEKYHGWIEGNFVDLNGICDLQLTEAGILPQHVDRIKICTRCDPSWFSFRRDQTPERFGTWVRLVK